MKVLLCSDKYQYTMGHTFVKEGLDQEIAIFNMFFRKAPDGNGFAVVSGIKEVLDMICTMGKYDKKYYKKFLPHDEYDEYCELLSKTIFTGSVRGMEEGEIVFPNQPIITITAPLLQAQILETPMLAIMNHQMAIATKASRVSRSTKKPVSEFGSRRAHGIWAATYGAKAAYIGGCANTSNVLSTIGMNVPSTGTMAHSYVTAFGVGPKAEYKAFDAYIKTHAPQQESLIMLIDTYDTLCSGIKNAIKAFKDNGINDYYSAPYGVRLDSGDLAYLSQECRRMLDEAGLTKAIISATNGLDEYIIPQLELQGAQIDMYGVGDAIATSKHNPCFGGVYKLVQIGEQPVIKLSEDRIKVTNPGNLITIRMVDKVRSENIADVTCIKNDATHLALLKGEEIVLTAEDDKTKQTKYKADTYNAYEMQTDYIIDGFSMVYDFSIEDAKAFYNHNLSMFHPAVTRLINPHIYKNNISDELYNLKTQMIYEIKEAIEKEMEE